MIHLGLDGAAKDAAVTAYCAAHGVRRVVVFSPAKYRRPCSFPAHEHVEWAEIILYKFYYRLLQDVDGSTLLVVDECLRAQNRHDLTYNCLRLFANQTPHVLVFQYLPLIDAWDDFAVLFDLVTRSRWKREKVGGALLREARVRVEPVRLELRPVEVKVDDRTRAAYAREKEKLLAQVRGDPGKDPHVIPRNLLLVGGRAKLAHVDPTRAYLGRNDRFKLPNLETYREPSYPRAPYTVFELPHGFLDLVDVLALSRQASFDVLVADLKADRWYLERFRAWAERLREAYRTLGVAP